MIQGQHIHSVDYYLQKWDTIATDILVSLLVLWLLALIAARLLCFLVKYVSHVQ
jgi:hypothetical protein